MYTLITVLIIVLIAAAIALFFLYRAGMKMQTEQARNQATLDRFAQVATLLVIDKKKMKFKEAPFPKEVFETAPRRARLYLMQILQGAVPSERNIRKRKKAKEKAEKKASGNK